jgi:predicted nucleic acid-binding Zn ribbon protein
LKSASELAKAAAGRFFDEETQASLEESVGLFASWKAAVENCGLGEAASCSKIAAFDRETVTVEASHPAWIQLLQTRKEAILAELRKSVPSGKVKDIRFKLARS